MAENNQLVRIPDDEALLMLRVLANEDIRNLGTEAAWIIRKEFNSRGLSMSIATQAAVTAQG